MLVGEPGVLLPGRLLPVGGPLARIRDRQRRGEHQHLAHAALGVGLQDHPAEPRVDRQLREPAAEVGEWRPSASNAPSSCSSATPSRMLRASGGSRNGKSSMSPRSQRRHLQDHRGEVGAQDLRVGEARPRRRSPPRSTAGCRCRARCARSGRRAARPTPARSARSAAAAPWCGGCSGRCARCRGRRRSGCRARSATSRRRWWPARSAGRCAAGRPAAARRSAAARTAAAPRCSRQTRRAAPRRCRGSRARRTGTPARRRAARPPARRRRRRSPRSGRAARCARPRGRGRRDRRRRRPATATSRGR